MTITIVCDILGEENNGTTIACMNLIRYLRAQGHTVRVVCADQDKAGNECFYVVPERNLYLLNPIVERNGVTLPRVDRSILEEAIRDCDVVHTTFVLRLSHTAVKIAKAYNKPITSSFHCQAENVTAHFLCKDSAAINRGVYRACYQMVYQYSDIIHYPTQFIRDTFEAVVGPTNGRVISNGVNSMFTPGPATRPEGLEDKFLIVSTGRLLPFALNSDLSGDSTEKKVEKSSVVLYLSTRAVIDSVTAPSELCFCDILKSEISAPHAVSRYTSSRMPDAGAKGAKSQPKWKAGFLICTSPVRPLRFFGVLMSLVAPTTKATGPQILTSSTFSPGFNSDFTSRRKGRNAFSEWSTSWSFKTTKASVSILFSTRKTLSAFKKSSLTLKVFR